MTDQPQHPALHVPAREVPVPTSVSEPARAVLTQLAHNGVHATDYPPVDDLDAWRKTATEIDEYVLAMFAGMGQASTFGEVTLPFGSAHVEQIDADGAVAYDILPSGVAADDRRLYLEIHGGAWVQGGGQSCRLTGIGTAARVGARVRAVDYRLLPDHPFPAPLDDCLAVYRHLLTEREPHEIVLGGTSAGGNLALALLLKAREQGLPLPVAVVLDSPVVDLTGSGDSWRTNFGLDDVLGSDPKPAMQLYTGGHDPKDPYLSPLFGDLAGLPPTLLSSGTRDMVLSDTVRMHRALRAAGVEANLHVLEAAGHGKFLGAGTEFLDLVTEVRAFVDRHWAAAAR